MHVARLPSTSLTATWKVVKPLVRHAFPKASGLHVCTALLLVTKAAATMAVCLAV
jgi:hypothetical protein